MSTMRMSTGLGTSPSVTQIVRPAGAGHETVVVLAGCALILAVAASVVSLRATSEESHSVAAHQVDARRDLTAAEQGLYADLRVALDEIEAARSANGGMPSVAALAEWGLPPFVQDASSAQRGGHAWTLAVDGSTSAYLGLTADTTVAGSLLLRVPSHAHAHGVVEAAPDASTAHAEADADVWLHRTAQTAPAALDEAALARAGWRQIAARFDAGVTRQRR